MNHVEDDVLEVLGASAKYQRRLAFISLCANATPLSNEPQENSHRALVSGFPSQ